MIYSLDSTDLAFLNNYPNLSLEDVDWHVAYDLMQSDKYPTPEEALNNLQVKFEDYLKSNIDRNKQYKLILRYLGTHDDNRDGKNGFITYLRFKLIGK